MAQKKNANNPEEKAETHETTPHKHTTPKHVGEEKRMSKRRAVIVGINDYQGTWNDLPSCVKDAESFRDYLNHKLGFTEIRVLTDKQATRSNVTAGLDWLFENATAQDRLVFFYSGHGTTKPDGNVMQEYLCLYDDILQDDELSRRTQDLPDGVFTAIIDCCFSGGMEKRRYEAVVQGFGESSVGTIGHIPSLSVERSQVKTFLSDPQQLRMQEDAEERATFYKPFAQSTRLTPGGFRKTFQAQVAEESDLVMRGTLLAASLETETAAAATSQTNGLSAFTFALLKVFEGRGQALSLNELVQLITIELRMLGLRQSPRLKTRPPQLAERPFLSMEHVSMPSTYGERQIDRRTVESLAYAVLNNVFSMGTQARNPWTVTTPQWRENMYTQSNVANITASVIPQVMESVQREYARRGQVHAFSPAFGSWAQPALSQPWINPGAQLHGFAPQFGAFPTTQPYGYLPQIPGLLSQPFGYAPQLGISPVGGINVRPLQFCALECAQRIASQVLQTLPIEYRHVVQPALASVIPLIVETVSREINRLHPYLSQAAHNIRERQHIEWTIYNIIVSIVDSIIREHHVRVGQQYGFGYGAVSPMSTVGYGFAGMVPQTEQIVIWQTINAIVPTIVELIERERVRLTQVGQQFTHETVNLLVPQIVAHVQQMPIPANVALVLPTIIDAICRQLVLQTPLTATYGPQAPITGAFPTASVAPTVPAFNMPAMA